VEGQRKKAVQDMRRGRDNARVERALAKLKDLAAKPPSETGNLMPHLIEAVEAYATIGEICTVLRGVWGEFKEPAVV
jgi:methylmalonyl-CoA mutase N-terminal domain/subunit